MVKGSLRKWSGGGGEGLDNADGRHTVSGTLLTAQWLPRAQLMSAANDLPPGSDLI